MLKKLSLAVIGGTAAGMSAAIKTRSLIPDLSITVFERTNYVTYGSCGIPYYIGGEISDYNELITYTPTSLKKERNIEVHVGHEVTKIDLNKRIITIKDLQTGKMVNNIFKKLVIATGASPIIPNISGISSPLVHKVRTIEDALKIKNDVERGFVKKVVIIGAGFIGLEMAEALSKWNIEVILLEALPTILPRTNPMLVKIIEDEIAKNGIKLYTNTRANKVISDIKNKKAVVFTVDGKQFDANMIIVSIGVRPNSQIAETAGISIGKTGGIVVNEYMETNIDNIWACGDCVQMQHLISGEPCWYPLGPAANKQGKIVGENIAGGKVSFPNVLGTQVTKIFDLYVGMTGLSEIEAQKFGFDTALVEINHRDKASYYPNVQNMYIVMVINKSDGRILGVQLVGSILASIRIDVFATAITMGVTTRQLAELDLAYAPPMAPVYDPIIIAGIIGVKKLKRLRNN
jgi:NADPH-dependent 2,4-dienoyl-CoA reductase/sulfur reductase-like enzyme